MLEQEFLGLDDLLLRHLLDCLDVLLVDGCILEPYFFVELAVVQILSRRLWQDLLFLIDLEAGRERGLFSLLYRCLLSSFALSEETLLLLRHLGVVGRCLQRGALKDAMEDFLVRRLL